jgi:rhodanese-related sulfurtransferase
MTSSISPQEVKEKMDNNENIFILDVREPYEYENWHIKGAVNIPLGVITADTRSVPKNKEIIAVCLHGMRSVYAQQILSGLGYNAKSMLGGMADWNSVYDLVDVHADGDFKILQSRRIGKGVLELYNNKR